MRHTRFIVTNGGWRWIFNLPKITGWRKSCDDQGTLFASPISPSDTTDEQKPIETFD